MGSKVLRTINGNEYLYYVYYLNHKRKEVYCGLATKPESQTKAKAERVEELIRQRKIINKKITVLNSEIRHDI